MVDEPVAEEHQGGDPACWADEFAGYLGLDDPADGADPTEREVADGDEDSPDPEAG